MSINISAVIVTRGDHDLTPIIDSLPFEDIIVYDNSKKKDLAVAGRYQGIRYTENQFIYVQDDDCIVPVDKLLEHWDGSMESILLNMPANHGTYFDSGLVGWGAIFHKDLPWLAFDKYSSNHRDLNLFNRCCDVVFTSLTPFTRVDLGHESLPYAFGLDRMYHQPNHDIEREMVLGQCRRIKGV